MSIHTITIDAFMQLPIGPIRTAIRLFHREIKALEGLLARGQNAPATLRAWEQQLADYRQLLGIFEGRLEDLEAETNGTTTEALTDATY